MFLYLAMLLVHLSTSLVNYSLAAYCGLIPEGEISIAAALAPALPMLHHNTPARAIHALCPLFGC
jgi:hypothetical protein